MTGQELKQIITDNGSGYAVISKESGVPEQTIYTLIKKDKVPDHYIQKLAKAIPELRKTMSGDIEKEMLREQVKTLKDYVDTLKLTLGTMNFLLVKQAPENELEVVKAKKGG